MQLTLFTDPNEDHYNFMALKLTPKEREVVQALGTYPNLAQKNVAWALGMSYNTFSVHLRNAYRKLRIANRTQLFIFAVSAGLVPPPPIYRVTDANINTA